MAAPNPKKKATRVLKTDIPPPPTSSAPLSKVSSQVDIDRSDSVQDGASLSLEPILASTTGAATSISGST